MPVVKFGKKKAESKEKLIEGYVQEYNKLREEKSIIEKRLKKLSETIKEYASENGVKDKNGSFLCENDTFIFGAQSKKSVSLNEEGMISLCKEKGLNNAVAVKEYIDKDVLDKYIDSGDITREEVESLSSISVSYSVVVKAKESIPQVEECKAVASRRKYTKKG